MIKEKQAVLIRAGSCLGEIKLSSTNDEEQKDGLSLLQMSAIANDAYGLFYLYHIRGEKVLPSRKRGKKDDDDENIYKKCERYGFSDVSLFVPLTKSRDRKQEEDWHLLLCRSCFNTCQKHQLNIARFFFAS